MDMSVKSEWSVEVYMSATEELIKEVQYAMDYLKLSLGKYVDVPAVMSRLPPPPQMFPSDDGDDEMELNDEDYDDDGEEMQKFIRDEYKLQQLYRRHEQQELEVVQMLQLTNYLKRVMPHPNLTCHVYGPYGYAYVCSFAAEILSTIQWYDGQLHKAVDSYNKKLYKKLSR